MCSFRVKTSKFSLSCVHFGENFQVVPFAKVKKLLENMSYLWIGPEIIIWDSDPIRDPHQK